MPTAPCLDQHHAWTASPAASLQGLQQYCHSPLWGLTSASTPQPPHVPTTIISQQASGRSYLGVSGLAEHSLAGHPACTCQGQILQHSTGTACWRTWHLRHRLDLPKSAPVEH